VKALPDRYGVTHWTSRTPLFLGVGGTLLVAAVVLRNPVPLFFALALLLAPFVAAWSYPRTLGSVDLAWKDLGAGPEIRIRGSLVGEFGGSAGNVSLRFPLPPGVAVGQQLRYVRGPQEIRFGADWRSVDPYPSLQLSAVVRWSDPFGLGERLLEGARPVLSVERPSPELRSVAALQLARVLPTPGETRARRAGISTEFVGVRSAGAGESVRLINWRATARAGRLVANEYEAELRADVILMLDLRPTGLGEYYDELLLRLAQAACLGLVRPFIRNKLRVGWATFGEHVEALPLGTGRVHGHRVVEAIVGSRRSARAGPAEWCAVGLGRFFRPGTTIIIVSSWGGEPTWDLAPYLRHAGFPVVTFSPSPVPLRAWTGRLGSLREGLAIRVERLERRARLSTLWKYGPVVDWENYGSLEGLRLALRAAGRRRFS
jgi:uncharacterized protein (DUF58 family)